MEKSILVRNFNLVVVTPYALYREPSSLYTELAVLAQRGGQFYTETERSE